MNDRGQLILIAGVLLAIVFVALALLVNAAIYTDNVATRGGDSAAEPLEYRAGVVDAIGGLLDAENVDGGHPDRPAIRDALADGTAVIDENSSRYHLRRGVVTSIETESFSTGNTADGVFIERSESGAIDNWTADDASGVRSFEIAFDADSIGGEPFNITLGSTELFVYENATSGNVTVAKDAVEDEICSADASGTLRFGVTDGTLGEEPCRFEWPSIDEVRFQNDGGVSGTYRLTLEASDTSEFPSEIRATEAIYSADVELRVETPDLRYETTVRIAPGEPDA